MACPPSPEACVEHKLSTIAKETKMVKRVKQAQWLRAAILGASDGLLSTSSLMMGIGAAKEDQQSMILSGLAGALAGACSMAVGEFVSVSTQRDIEQALISKCSSGNKSETADDGVTIKVEIDSSAPSTTSETRPAEANLATNNALSDMGNVVSPDRRVPLTMPPGDLLYTVYNPKSPVMKAIVGDARGTIQGTEQDSGQGNVLPNPYKAGAASALAFLCGAFVPLAAAMIVAQNGTRIIVIVVVTSIALALSGGVGARFGGSPVIVSALRVLVGGWISMAITYGLLKSFSDDHGGHDD